MSFPKIMLLVDREARTIAVTGKGGKSATVAVEDFHLSLRDELSAQLVQSAIDVIHDDIDGAIDEPPCRCPWC